MISEARRRDEEIYAQVFITATPHTSSQEEQKLWENPSAALRPWEGSKAASEKVLFHITLSLKIEIYRILKQKAKVSAIPAAPRPPSTA